MLGLITKVGQSRCMLKTCEQIGSFKYANLLMCLDHSNPARVEYQLQLSNGFNIGRFWKSSYAPKDACYWQVMVGASPVELYPDQNASLASLCSYIMDKFSRVPSPYPPTEYLSTF